MSTVFDCDGVKHWVSHTVRDEYPADLVLVIAHTYCYTIRRFQRGNVLLEDGAPTCLTCIHKHDVFRRAEKVMRDAGGLERFHRMHYGEYGEPAP